MTCLELAQLGARRGRAPLVGPTLPSLPEPARTAGWGRGTPWDGISSGTESQSQSSRTCPQPGLARGPPPPDRPEALNLALLQGWRERPSLGFWGANRPFSPCHKPTDHCPTPHPPPPSFRHSRTHPVSSTLSPRTVLIQSAPFYYVHKITPTPSVAETKSKVPPESALYPNEDQNLKVAPGGLAPRPQGLCTASLLSNPDPHPRRTSPGRSSCLRVSSLLQAGPLR